QTPIREALVKAVHWFNGGAGFACDGRRPQAGAYNGGAGFAGVASREGLQAGAYDDERARREQRGVS
ncbi:MAG: hypothetical protein ACJ784_19785, partial [Myxococcales bacterium]